SDRHCPEEKNNDPTQFDGSPIRVCQNYANGQLTADEIGRVNKLTTGDETKAGAFHDRQTGSRFMTSVLAELSTSQHWNFFGILAGGHFQNDRAPSTSDFSPW